MASQLTRADAGMAALQNFYNASTGLFSTLLVALLERDGQYITFNVEVKNPGAVQLIFYYAAAAGNASREIFVNGRPSQHKFRFPQSQLVDQVELSFP